MPLETTNTGLVSVLNNSVTGDNISGPSIVSIVLPLILIFPISILDPSMYVVSFPFLILMLLTPLKSTKLASILVVPVSKST